MNSKSNIESPGLKEPAEKTAQQSNNKPSASNIGRRLIRRLVILPVVAIAGLYFLSFSAPRPTNLGVTNGKLANCPDSPNCVSSQSENPDQQMSAIGFTCSAYEMQENIKQTIEAEFPRAKLVSELNHYLHYEFTSLVFRFVDDVEFFVDDKASLVQFRSASRVGHSDLGANRKRMNKISESLKQ